MKRVSFDEEDLKVIFGEYMTQAGFLHEGQSIGTIEYRTRTIKKNGDYFKDVIPPTERDLFLEGESEQLVKIVIGLKGQSKYESESGES